MWPVGKRLSFTALENPFPAYGHWDQIEDEGLEFVEIGPCVAELPKGDPRLELEDGLVVFMQEAWRCLEPGGYLRISHYLPDAWKGVADPLICRYLHPEVWRYFAHPADKDADEWKWRRKECPVRFGIIAEGNSDQGFDITMEKPRG